jgi:putative DNA primase/helicase
MSSSPLLSAALSYAARGWAVFPLNGKLPLKGSHGHLDATTDAAQVRRWWTKYPDANIGLACSSTRGPVVIDVDGPEGDAAARLLQLPPTREATSGRPHRRHLYFDPPVSGVRISRQLHLRPELDILGDGGYVVAPPSIHPATKQPYRWLNSLAPVPFPESVIALLAPNGENKKTSAPPLPKTLTEGQRDAQLTSLAGSMRRRGASEDAIYAALQEENTTRCQPPLPDKQLRKIAHSIAQYEPAVTIEPLDDIGNARRFVRLHGEDVRYVPKWRSWLLWDGTRWKHEATREAQRWAEDVIRDILAQAQANADDDDLVKRLTKHAASTASQRKRSDLLETVKHQRDIVLTPDQLDAAPWLLNVNNGTLDLRTGRLGPHRREDLLTKLAPVTFDPAATCPLWDRTLARIMNNDTELVAFLQRAIGYSLVGDTQEECFFFCYGTGRNGKTTLLETIHSILGDYAILMDFSSLLLGRFHRESRDTPRLAGIRFAMANETPTDARFDEATVKQLTSTDTIHARRLYQEPFTFRPTHTLWLRANDKPTVRDASVAFWRRIRFIPFTVCITPQEQIKDLGAQLLREASGILAWAVAGCMDWQRDGMAAPKSVLLATAQYRQEEDVIGEFISARCRIRQQEWTATAALYQNYFDWSAETRGPRTTVMSPKAFGRALERRGKLQSRKQQGVRGWSGIGLKDG